MVVIHDNYNLINQTLLKHCNHDAKNVFLGVVNLYPNKPYSKHVHLHFFTPLPIMQNEKGRINFIVHFTTHNHIYIAKTWIVNIKHILVFWPCATILEGCLCRFTLISAKFSEILLLFVTYWTTLFMTCLKYAQSKGMGKLDVSHEIIDFKVVVMFVN